MTKRGVEHPATSELTAFAHGRLPWDRQAAVEQHLLDCDSCCELLQSIPDDTLVLLARQRPTEAWSEAAPLPAQQPVSNPLPVELMDHPRYEVLRQIGLGGMGAVYKARHRLMERQVALKVIRKTFTNNPQAVERFRREVKAAARLQHANIVTAFDAEQAGDLHFLVMEYVEGVSLDRLVAKQGLPTVAQSCGLIRQAALGLQHAHERRMVHRDIKPANLMVTTKGQVKILDFGLARLAREVVASDDRVSTSDPRGSSDATTADMILGTPDYIAPEQAKNSHLADIRADIYSLGCTFYFLLTGKPPFPRKNVVEVLAAHAEQAPPPIKTLCPQMPSEVARVLERMLAKRPEDRYATPVEVAKELAAIRANPAPSAATTPIPPTDDLFAGLEFAVPPATHPAPPPLAKSFADKLRERRWLLAIAGAVLALCLLVALVTSPTRQTRVLLCVPHSGVYVPDVTSVMPTLQSDAIVTLASTQRGPCESYEGGTSRYSAAVQIGVDSISPEQFDAIVFVGAKTSDFHNPATAALLGQFVTQDKVVGGLGTGQEVLIFHGLIKPGQRVAKNKLLTWAYQKLDCDAQNLPVVRDGCLVTGRDNDAGPEFARELLSAIHRTR